jgi:hypothetical protein
MESFGISGLDEVVTGLRLGDNVVWQIDDIGDYQHFAARFVKTAIRQDRRVVYVRFADHAPILRPQRGLTICTLDAHAGFESFSAKLNGIITQQGRGAYYVFDCLSDLLSAWSNDLMIGNFFKITCPYLYELDTIAYFALLRNSHSYKTVARIRETTQLLIDLYDYDGKYYIHPLKVWNRYSPTMFLPHVQKGERFVAIASSADTAKLFSDMFKEGSRRTERNLDNWDRLFLKAEGLMAAGGSSKKKRDLIGRICRIMIAREPQLLGLATAHFSLQDLVDIKSKMIGTGCVGGKAVGMLLARSILSKAKGIDVDRYFEPHDSFFIGSDVFYTYLVENGWWKLRMAQRTKEGYFEVGDVLKDKMLGGAFPEGIEEQFRQMIEYFGQSPIIVRSSSLLEDSFGNTFAGKYDSLFLVNQGTPEQRYEKFVEAVRQVYASTMNRDALAYRLQRGLADSDEQMALLVQRVSGSYKHHLFFPDLAGVGISYNTLVWKQDMNPRAGMLRLVLGLGTRAVNRVEGDYPRIVALDRPLLRPHGGMRDTRRFSQHDVDLLNTRHNTLETVAVRTLIAEKVPILLDLIGVRDYDLVKEMPGKGRREDEPWVLTFDKLLSATDLRDVMQRILKTLEAHYGHPVEIEYTVNFIDDRRFQINLLQCRPLQTKGFGRKPHIPGALDEERVIARSHGSFLGGNISQAIRRIIYVDPTAYSLLSESAKHDIPRLIGGLNARIADRETMPVLLLGPGRWGTSTASLGVPVSFAHINHIAVLGEMAFSSGDAMPELSFGTHFFQDLVESSIFYFALFPDQEGSRFNRPLLESFPNVFAREAGGSGTYAEVVKVYEPATEVRLMADVVSQELVLFRE